MHQATKCTKPPNTVKGPGGCSDTSHSECGGQCGEHCIIQASNIDVELPYGHHANKSQNPAQMVCSVPVERIVPGCNHKVTLPCCVDVTARDYGCEEQKCRPLIQGRTEKEQHSEAYPPYIEQCARLALLEERQWRFIVWSHRKYLELAGNMQQVQGELIDSRSDAPPLYCGDIQMSQGFHLDMVANLPGLSGRYHKLSMLRGNCEDFCQQVEDDEKPLKCIAEALDGHRSSVGEMVGSFQYDQALLRTRADQLALSLCSSGAKLWESPTLLLFTMRCIESRAARSSSTSLLIALYANG
jgi:hypothetical protein